VKINKFEYSIGNSKLGKDTLIFNMTSATDCPSRKLGLCRHASKCYALKAEKLYPGCLPYRRRQAHYWRNSSSVTIALDINDALKRHKAVKYIRFSESGDFTTQDDVNKIYRVANLCPAVVFYGHTSRRDLNFGKAPANLIFNGSGFMLDNKYTAVAEYTVTKRTQCDSKICATCTLCKTKGKKTIENLFH
jgi:hypothetical protein